MALWQRGAGGSTGSPTCGEDLANGRLVGDERDVPFDFAHKDSRKRGYGCGPFTEEPPQTLRHGNDPLPDGDWWDDVIVSTWRAMIL